MKDNPNHKAYLEIIRQMTPEQRLNKTFALSEFSKKLFAHGIRKRFPDIPDEEVKKVIFKRLEKCHNRNY
jgi:hypothetical protein